MKITTTTTITFIAGITIGCITSITFAQRVNSGLDNQVLELYGWPDAVVIPHHQSINPLNEMTIEFWIQSNDDFWGRPITKRPGNGGCYTINVGTDSPAQCDNGTVSIFGNCNGAQFGTEVICDWTHLAVVVDGPLGISRSYINGVLADESVDMNPGCTIGQGSWDLMFGNTPGFSETQFEGRLDNVRIWQTALDQGAIQYWMHNDITPAMAAKMPELGGSWNFEIGATDATGVNNGSLAGNAAIVVDNFRGAPLNPVQWTTDSGGNGHWYSLLTLPTWGSAEVHFATAETLGGHTVTFASAAENNFCFELSLNALNGLHPFIGLRKQEGNNQGAWITGEPYNYTNWAGGEGDNSWERYANIWVEDYQTPQWQDTDLTAHPNSIVEWDADCNGDGIVDYGQILDGTFEDVNGNGVPDCCEGGIPCSQCELADFNNDSQVNVQDVLALIAWWGPCTACDVDIDNNGDVNISDLLFVISEWGACP